MITFGFVGCSHDDRSHISTLSSSPTIVRSMIYLMLLVWSSYFVLSEWSAPQEFCSDVRPVWTGSRGHKTGYRTCFFVWTPHPSNPIFSIRFHYAATTSQCRYQNSSAQHPSPLPKHYIYSCSHGWRRYRRNQSWGSGCIVYISYKIQQV